MKSVISKICAKLGNSFNVNALWFLTKQRLSRSFSNVTNVKKTSTKIMKPNFFVSGKKHEPPIYQQEEKIGITGYSLLSIPISAFMLGTWQIQRRQEKLDLIEKLKSRTNYEPTELPENLEDLEMLEYYPIKLKGTFLYDKEFIIGHRSLLVNGVPAVTNTLIGTNQRGYHVITPFKLADRDLTILVNRGWIPSTLKNSKRRESSQIKDETEITGILRLNERRPPFVPKNQPHSDIWHYRDLDAMAKKGDTSSIYIEMISNNNTDQYPIGGQTKVELRNEHMSYILTWYCLSASTAFLWYRKFIKGIPFVE